MRDSFRRELDGVADRLVGMCELVGAAMRGATMALLDNDLVLAEKVIHDDNRVDVARADCEERAHALLALQAPVARDLRVVIAAVHAADSVERMGDLAVHVARTTRRRHPNPVLPTELRGRFANLGQICVTLADTAAQVIRTRDLVLAAELADTDNTVNALHSGLMATLMSPDWPHGVATAVDVSQLSRFYERFGDHAVSLARRTAYVVTGDPRPPHLGRAA
ncbi:phosphate signaling complex protein PhoU [Kutzneria viridogrisea]|uniref:Phosphate-specific transport system accessory protein PhoU n=2 Tax=Kutzneria TaxID=43356 RepID=W5WEV9_9PSEU|nr:phosphate signaling complex protein PhoU [Kutzneria albida]AHH99743.1 hypothetical protein KALB_6383 [Kutzneria albida DSM 43870]MBA8924920.1 phosphate transport system protein [Kutzneria viridogrisea]